MSIDSPVHLLDRELPAGYLEEATRHLAEPRPAPAQDIVCSFVFRLGEEWLALPTAVLAEVTDVRGIHSLPHRRNAAVLGLASLRGELLVVVALAALLGIGSDARERTAQRLLVVQRAGRRLAFAVDAVHGVQRHARSELREVPATVAKAGASYTSAILPLPGRSVGLLDAELLFDTLDRSLS
ncbi:MAG: cheW-like domain protein [Moraxellaceae bacterium]|jgi:chemotaxis-related protein WspD|nr:cheW-like domain protein [Moraxellaceae bacterium]